MKAYHLLYDNAIVLSLFSCYFFDGENKGTKNGTKNGRF